MDLGNNAEGLLPREQLVVITGLSGSGKSSLAFDTLYAEGQRKYVESLSVHARLFLEQIGKPDVERIEGLPLPPGRDRGHPARARLRTRVPLEERLADRLRLEHRRVGPHLAVAGHTGLGRRDAREGGVLDRRVAVAAIDSESGRVVIVAERDRLLQDHVLAGHEGGVKEGNTERRVGKRPVDDRPSHRPLTAQEFWR